MMIQVQLSSKMWHKQLLFIMFSSKVGFELVANNQKNAFGCFRIGSILFYDGGIFLLFYKVNSLFINARVRLGELVGIADLDKREGDLLVGE